MINIKHQFLQQVKHLFWVSQMKQTEFSKIIYLFPTSYLIVCIASYINLIFVFSLASKIFIADDFTLNGKSTNFVAVVKSSKIITGKLSLR
jgi:hypothetical protein